MKYEQLVEFKRKKGHCMVPSKYKEDKYLGWWVSRQRASHANNKLGIDRERILDELGFAWKADLAQTSKPVDDKLWHQQYEKLLEYKQKNGNFMVPKRYEQDKALGRWVTRQRSYHNTNRMRLDRKRILDKIGFAWKPDAASTFKPDDKLWHQQYEKLVDLKRINGNCKKVPNKDQQDKSLGQWIRYQRYCQNRNRMRRDRKELLDALDFDWKADSLAAGSSATDVRGYAI
jgi:hypothetical protein